MKRESELFIAHVPVIHDGYIRAFGRHPEAEIGVLQQDVLGRIDYLRKDIRALLPQDAVFALRGLGRRVQWVDAAALDEVMTADRPVVMPRDDVSREISAWYPDKPVELEPVFLRWDRDNVSETASFVPDREVRIDGDDELIRQLRDAASHSSNWWRAIASAVLDRHGRVINIGNNGPLPTEHTSWIDSDPRIVSSRGADIDLTLDIHAEAKVIAEAARRGESLEGGDIYATTFPCPGCAKLICAAGIKRCYFIDGYATLDGYDLLKAYGVELVKVLTDPEQRDERQYKPYRKR